MDARRKNSSRREDGSGDRHRQQEFTIDSSRDVYEPPLVIATAVPMDSYYGADSNPNNGGKVNSAVHDKDTGYEGTRAVESPSQSKGLSKGSNNSRLKTTNTSEPERSSSSKNPPMLFEVGRQSSIKWPKRLCQEVITSFGNPIDEPVIKDFLQKHNWTSGMQTAFLQSCKKIPIRFFIVDDSGSMVTTDGT